MAGAYEHLIAETLVQQTGVAVLVAEPRVQGLRRSLVATFDGFRSQEGPRFSIQPEGLKRHKVAVTMGNFSGPCIDTMRRASDESLQMARSFLLAISGLEGHTTKLYPDLPPLEWFVAEDGLKIDVIAPAAGNQYSDEAYRTTATNVMAPLIAAIGGLIGYEEQDLADGVVSEEEGAVYHALVKKRERSVRNRMLCLMIHGDFCGVCGNPGRIHPALPSLIEVHHIEPVSALEAPRPYDPRADLIPLCPCCHRAIHTRTPPYLPDELRGILHNAS